MVGVTGYDSAFGYVRIIKMKDSKKRAFTYKGSKDIQITAEDEFGNFKLAEVGSKFIAKATVKHSSYNGKDCTYLQRIKAIY